MTKQIVRGERDTYMVITTPDGTQTAFIRYGKKWSGGVMTRHYVELRSLGFKVGYAL